MNSSGLESEDNVPSLEIVSNYRLITYDRPIEVEKDSDFIDSEVSSKMEASPFYRNRFLKMTKSNSDRSDTLKDSRRIPNCVDVEETTRILPDGGVQLKQNTILNPGENPLLGFRDSEVDTRHAATMLDIEDGHLRTYNSEGEMLSDEEIQMPDYCEFLAELERLMEEYAVDTKSGNQKRDIDWLRRKMEKQCMTKSVSESYRIYEKGDRVVMEQCVNQTKSGEGMVVRTYLSSDISRNYGYEQLENGVLKVRCTHTFSESDSPLTRSNIPVDGITEENPERTVTEMMDYLTDGTPMIRVTDKKYRMNTIRYNVKH